MKWNGDARYFVEYLGHLGAQQILLPPKVLREEAVSRRVLGM